MASYRTFIITAVVVAGGFLGFWLLGKSGGFAGFERLVSLNDLLLKESGVSGGLKDYDLKKIRAGIKTDCESGDSGCFSGILKEVTAAHGPDAGLALLKNFQDTGEISRAVDDHQLAHAVGRRTAAVYGSNGESCLLCPTTFNYGCQHGFFEQVLGETGSATEAAEQICGSFGENFSEKFKFYCYHGVGHGVLMAVAYDLYKGLQICDGLETFTGQDGCWQGLFMENVNAGMRGEAREGIFSESEPLLPCSKMDEKYQHECYINHAGWLARVFNNDVSRAAKACLGASGRFARSCLESIGLMVTNPSWQGSLVKGGTGDFSEMAWGLCLEFPEDYRDSCVLGAVDNLLNFDEFETGRADKFCSAVDSEYQSRCYHRIGAGLMIQAVDADLVEKKCRELPSEFRNDCLAGASLL